MVNQDHNSQNDRSDAFKRNDHLENYIRELNSDLWYSEKRLLESGPMSELPLIFIVGPLRSGTTLLLQWLANLAYFSYPTNFLSRFYGSPIIGAKVQALFSDPRNNFREELFDLAASIDYTSDNGKTRGALSPNEFWYFWRRFLDDNQIGQLSDQDLFESVDVKLLRNELIGIAEVFSKPFAMKAMNFNYNIPFLHSIFPKAIFLHTIREPIANIRSVLDARIKQFNDVTKWYSFIIPETEALLSKTPQEQAAGQIYYNHAAILDGLRRLPSTNKLHVNYEDFCGDPLTFFTQLKDRLIANGYDNIEDYTGPKSFSVTNKSIIDSNIKKAAEVYDWSILEQRN